MLSPLPLPRFSCCKSLAAARGRLSGRRTAPRLLPQVARRPEGCEGGGATDPAAAAAAGDGASQRAVDLRRARQRVAALEQHLQQLVEQQSFGAAAEQRDALRQAQLRLRQVELAAAAEAKAGAGVRHSLGSVVVHARYSYRGVIIGYDPCCAAPEEWIQMMRVDALQHGRRQPFYHVLVDVRDRPGGQTCYVAQENVVPMRAPREVRHELVHRYFTAFSPEEGYVPAPLLRAAYPQDF